MTSSTIRAGPVRDVGQMGDVGDVSGSVPYSSSSSTVIYVDWDTQVRSPNGTPTLPGPRPSSVYLCVRVPYHTPTSSVDGHLFVFTFVSGFLVMELRTSSQGDRV